ncbi:MAG TPA: IS701 family transposase [Pseudonocardiaceae bacterium]|nr:IS701 family transposase [Pseudonocardiaceae bacterium]
MVAGHSVEPGQWQALLDELLARVAGRFGRVEPRRRVRGFVLGLLADLPRKNCWTIGEHAGDATPDGMQHLLSRAVWDTDGVRDDLCDYVVDHLGDPTGVLVVDETGDVKKGSRTVGAQRQYTGTAGRVENAQVAVYLTYAGQAGHAMIDRELYLPKSWATDPARCAGAGVPEDVEFATKPQLARAMIARALDAGVPARWATGDEVYGADPALRAELEARQVGYVLAIGCDRRLSTAAGPMRADRLAASVPKGAWARLSAGRGAKGHRYYDWAWITLTADSGHHWLLIRRHPRHGELAFYRCYSPTLVRLGELVGVAGRRWTIEESFQASKGLAGLDEHQVRRWRAWRRWTLLAMLAHALLAVIAATQRAQHPPPDGLIALTCNEIRHLFTTLITEPARRLTDPHAWSRWRRHHQHQARACHYRRQEAQLT